MSGFTKKMVLAAALVVSVTSTASAGLHSRHIYSGHHRANHELVVRAGTFHRRYVDRPYSSPRYLSRQIYGPFSRHRAYSPIVRSYHF